VIIAYFDAAYNHLNPNNPEPLTHTVAAYIGTVQNWRKFRKEWKMELAKKGLEHFHMTDFEFAFSRARAGKPIPHKNPFHGWKEDEFVPFLKRLHRTINRKSDGVYRLESKASSLIKAEFYELLPDELKNNSKCSSLYIFNAWTVMKFIAQWAKENDYPYPIHYTFAKGDGEGGNLERLFKDLWNSYFDRGYYHLSESNGVTPFSMEKMSDEPALQAADITAYEANKVALKWLEFSTSENPTELMRKSFASLAQTSHSGSVLTKEHLLKDFADIIRYESKRRELGIK
jgi:hypothetical protein